MPAFQCGGRGRPEPLLESPSSLPAVQLQLHMVESAIANAERDLEASWLHSFPQPGHGYIDEEWGFAGRRCSEALGDFRDARQKLLLRLEELQSAEPQASASEAKFAEECQKEQLQQLEFKLADEKARNFEMAKTVQQLQQTQASLERSLQSLESQCADLQRQCSAAESCKDQAQQWLERERLAHGAAMEQLRAENVELQRENAVLTERYLLQLRAQSLEENGQLRGMDSYPKVAQAVAARDCDASSDVSSWVCVSSSGPNVFAPGTMLKAKVGQAFEYLQAKDLKRGSQILASDDLTLLEVLGSPETQSSAEVVELWTEERMLCVACQQQILSATDEETTSTAQASPAEKLHPGDWIKVNGRFARLLRVEVRTLAEEEAMVKFDLSPNLPAATFSVAQREKGPFVAAV